MRIWHPTPILRAAMMLPVLILLALPVRGQTATPQAGEGIWGLLRRSGLTPTSALAKEFKELNASRLKGSDELKLGMSYQLPGAAGKATASEPQEQGRRYPIFGSQYELVVQKTRRLEGHYFYLVAGHGGPDPGTHGKFAGKPLPEDEVAYDTVLRAARRLIEEGATVYLIVRDENDGIRDVEHFAYDQDEVHLDGTPVGFRDDRLKKNAAIINDLYQKNRGKALSQQVISFHVDGYGGRHQPQIDPYFTYASDSGRSLGAVLQAELRDRYELHQPGRGYRGGLKERSLYILTHTKPTAVLIELGNIRHPGDQQRLVKPGNRQALAEWIVEGLVRKVEGGRSLAMRTE